MGNKVDGHGVGVLLESESWYLGRTAGCTGQTVMPSAKDSKCKRRVRFC